MGVERIPEEEKGKETGRTPLGPVVCFFLVVFSLSYRCFLVEEGCADFQCTFFGGFDSCMLSHVLGGDNETKNLQKQLS